MKSTFFPCAPILQIKILITHIAIYQTVVFILGDPGAVSGDGEKSKTGDKKFRRRKVKNAKKSPWGECFNGPVPDGQASSGF